MTNETTASQPKSIGDDAQFRARLADLYSAYDESIELGISEPNDRAVSKLIAAIDNFRAPAAQASATIQAAPEGTAMQRYKECSGDDEPSALERLRFFCSLALNGRDWLDSEKFFDDLAATIQEPVMVTEPVGSAVIEPSVKLMMVHGLPDWSKSFIDGFKLDQNGMNFLYRHPSAPMVADPAGVATGKALYESERPRLLVPKDWTFEDLPEAAQAEFNRRSATVKAVPSETLTCQHEFIWTAGELDVRFCKACGICESDAAPLADKTVGGE